MREGFVDPRRWASWLISGIGGAFQYAVGLHYDAMLEAGYEGTRRKFAMHAGDEELAYIGRDRGIPRLPTETAESYRIRLRQWLKIKKMAGTDLGIMAEMRAYWAPETPILRVVCGNKDRAYWSTLAADGTFSSLRREPTNWDWESNYPFLAPSDRIYRYWLIVYAPPIVTPNPTVVPPSTTQSIGSSLTTQEGRDLYQIATRTKRAGSICGGVIVSFDPLLFDPAGGPGIDYPDGWWYRHTRPDGSLTRPSTIRVYEETARR